MKLTDQEKLFNPDHTYVGDPSKLLEGYPERSKNLDIYGPKGENVRKLNSKFIKDGYMYLLRGARDGQENGFYSEQYSKKNTIESLKLDPNNVAYAQSMNGNTPFISATTDLYIAASFSNKQRIYILKIPVEDIYTFYQNDMLMEEEYMIPDYISKDEIIKSFRYDRFRQIYNYLTLQVGLKITPEDLAIKDKDLSNPDMDRIELATEFNNSGADLWDPILKVIQECYLEEKIEEQEFKITNSDKKIDNIPIRRIAIFTDAHGLYEPTLAVLQDIREKGIEEIYSLGDNIGLGPNPKEVLDLFDQYNVISLAGNYEEMLNLGVEPFLSYLSHEKIKDINWTKSVLTQEQIEKIKQYPHSIDLEVAGNKIALCHFANDVRCDFTKHDCHQYQAMINLHMPNASQFLYTNSMNQLLDISRILGMDYDSIKNANNFKEGLQIIRNYVSDNRKELYSIPELGGYLSYINAPLFEKDNKILTVKDYSEIIQGHTHFLSEVKDENTIFYTIRSVGTGYSEKEKKQAQYIILNEYEDSYDKEIVNVEFDREKMVDSIRKCPCPNSLIKKYTKM